GLVLVRRRPDRSLGRPVLGQRALRDLPAASLEWGATPVPARLARVLTSPWPGNRLSRGPRPWKRARPQPRQHQTNDRKPQDNSDRTERWDEHETRDEEHADGRRES